MVHARLDIGADNSGKRVAKVKNEAKNLAETLGKHYIIVDGSPGIGCPVVSSLAGASFVLLVTEPTVSGVHDLDRINRLIKRFGIPAGCIINKSDINAKKTREILEFLHKENILHLGNIPFDAMFTQAMTESRTIVETNSPVRHILKEMWSQLRNHS